MILQLVIFPFQFLSEMSSMINVCCIIYYAGAKDAHTVSPHFAQMLYFGLASALATAPLHYSLSHAAGLFRAFLQNRLLCAFGAILVYIAGFLSVHFFRSGNTYFALFITCCFYLFMLF